ncbi:YARHG domain-containing protein [Olleya sp. HaHaR_3_96]|uniref:YARHG domain-containing protein n=1 Tax=Olleya sp. HaHaR_3_96 TaxID=2745560 RepID=UPI001C4E5E13|nr:YARHG domain-containing protein [Olleya sp. HaHaR_3_96]QXP58661.1 YARHG domain-containing protein [Olleya sp. HaHaR_3_96]
MSQQKTYKAYANGIYSEEIDYHEYRSITNSEISDFQGSYGFGYSESEYQLEILYSNNKLYPREIYHPIIDGFFGNTIERILINYLNKEISLTNDISYTLFECFKTSINNKEGDLGIGYIIIEEDNGNETHSLVFHEKINSHIAIDGEFPETSFVMLTIEELKDYPSDTLKIIRNEIFARHGHIFISGGKMEAYFLQKKWYSKTKTITPNDLSTIEKHNIDIIRRLEQN